MRIIKIRKSSAMDAIPTAYRLVDAFIRMIDSGTIIETLVAHRQDSSEHMQDMLKEQYGDTISFQDGVLEDGVRLDGFTIHLKEEEEGN